MLLSDQGSRVRPHEAGNIAKRSRDVPDRSGPITRSYGPRTLDFSTISFLSADLPGGKG